MDREELISSPHQRFLQCRNAFMASEKSVKLLLDKDSNRRDLFILEQWLREYTSTSWLILSYLSSSARLAKEIRDGGPKQLGVESKCVASLSRLKETELVTVILSQGRDRASYHNKAQAAIFNEFTTRRFCQLGKLVSRSSAEKQGLATTELALMERRSCRLWSSIQ